MLSGFLTERSSCILILARASGIHGHCPWDMLTSVCLSIIREVALLLRDEGNSNKGGSRKLVILIRESGLQWLLGKGYRGGYSVRM